MSIGSGPAFPSLAPVLPQFNFRDGLSKRELFAAMAMQGQLSNPKVQDGTPEGIARWSLAYADALLAELERPAEKNGRVEKLIAAVDYLAKEYCQVHGPDSLPSFVVVAMDKDSGNDF